MTKEERHLASQLKACAKKMKSKMYHTRTFPLLRSEYVRLRRNDWDCYCYLEQPPIDEVDAWERERNRKKWCKNNQLYQLWLQEYIRDFVEMPEKTDAIRAVFMKHQKPFPKKLETEKEKVDACSMLVLSILHELAMQRKLFTTVSTSLATRMLDRFVSQSIERMKARTDRIGYEPPFEIHNEWEALCFQMQLGHEHDVPRYAAWVRKEFCYPVIAETFESGGEYTKKLGNSLARRLHIMDSSDKELGLHYIPRCYDFISEKVTEAVLDEAVMDMMFY
ncbi:hypothetical protein [Megasphaera sp.]|uniref:hypothetical protein n=1 Tax=Megasphaera sp. TaxID=2023260 RepID=UPI003FEE1022